MLKHNNRWMKALNNNRKYVPSTKEKVTKEAAKEGVEMELKHFRSDV